MPTTLVARQTRDSIINQLDDQATLKNWHNWKWQLKHEITDIDDFCELLNIELTPDEYTAMRKTAEHFPLRVTPYYASLIDPIDYQNDPVFKQAFPDMRELDVSRYDSDDPLHEEADSPVPGITHRYPDRVLFYVCGMCAMYCRHCTRKRKVGDNDQVPSRDMITQGINYIKSNPVIRDVLLSGGDPFLLSDNYLDWILGELEAIDHVEVIRIGTRTPVVLPYRITDNLVKVLKRKKPVWINTHFNHPREITRSSRKALAKLADSGIPLGNQSVLLAGVNDCPRIMKKLVHKLVQNRVRPYYLYQCDLSEGLSHFRTPVGKGIEIIENLIGHTSGFCVPTYVIDAPGGGGKIPIMPNYLISWSTNKVVLRNYEGVITTYNEPDSYEPVFCDRQCDTCNLDLKLDEANEVSAVGISKLMCDHDKTISLIPENNDRHERREED